MAKATITKSAYINTLNEAQIIAAVQAKKNPGTWRTVTWIHELFNLGASTDEYAIVFKKSCRIGLKSENVLPKKEAVVETKDGLITKETAKERGSSYTRLKDDDGNLIDPFFIMRDATTKDKKYLQCFYSNQHDTRRPITDATGTIIVDEKKHRKFHHRKTEVSYYKNGVKLDPTKESTLIKTIEATHKPKTIKNDSKTWALSLRNKIIEIK